MTGRAQCRGRARRRRQKRSSIHRRHLRQRNAGMIARQVADLVRRGAHYRSTAASEMVALPQSGGVMKLGVLLLAGAAIVSAAGSYHVKTKFKVGGEGGWDYL